MTSRADSRGQTPPPHAKLRQLPGLDGLRAFAVLAVIVYHLNPRLLPGGFLGVDVFFVISGYLITALLLGELGRTGGLTLRRFWSRRARRLFPALAILLVAVTLLARLFATDALHRMQVDVVSAVFFVFNWRLVAQHDSYLGSLGRPPLLLHLWSLSVEEQFYLLWPVALLFLRRRVRQGAMVGIALGGAALSALLMAVLFKPGNPSAVYFGTETHAEGLMIGAALAVALPPWRMCSEVTPRARRLLERAGLGALAVVVAGAAFLGFNMPFTYRGGMLIVDLATAVLVATIAHPATRLGPAFARRPWRWLGLRSYSLYLWHWPIFQLIPSPSGGGIDAFLVGILRLLVMGLAADLSFRFVEQPWRTGRAQAWLRAAWASRRRRRFTPVLAVPFVTTSLLLATAPAAPYAPAILLEGSTTAARVSPVSSIPTVTEQPSIGPWRTTTESVPPTTSPAVTAAPTTTTEPAAQYAAPPSDLPILAIGDSVLLAASPALQSVLGPAITVDAQVGRQVGAGLTRLAQYRSSGALSRYHTVLIDLGTNGAFEPAQFAQLLQLVAGVPHVVVFDIHADRPWVQVSNSTITTGVASRPAQTLLADWNRSAGPALLYSDGIHPNSAGGRVYTQLLVSALAQNRNSG